MTKVKVVKGIVKDGNKEYKVGDEFDLDSDKVERLQKIGVVKTSEAIETEKEFETGDVDVKDIEYDQLKKIVEEDEGLTEQLVPTGKSGPVRADYEKVLLDNRGE